MRAYRHEGCHAAVSTHFNFTGEIILLLYQVGHEHITLQIVKQKDHLLLGHILKVLRENFYVV